MNFLKSRFHIFRIDNVYKTIAHTSVLGILCLSSREVTPDCQASDLESVETWGQLHYSMYSTSEAPYLTLITKSFTLQITVTVVFSQENKNNVLGWKKRGVLGQIITHG